jgi:hypothetical protein
VATGLIGSKDNHVWLQKAILSRQGTACMAEIFPHTGNSTCLGGLEIMALIALGTAHAFCTCIVEAMQDFSAFARVMDRFVGSDPFRSHL